MNILVFNLLLAATCCHAIARGGAPERLVAAAFFAAAMATFFLPYRLGVTFQSIEPVYLAIDLLLFAGLTVVAALADRFWPIWLAAMQLVIIVVHAAKAYDPSILAFVYYGVTAKIAYPMLIILVIGTLRHRLRLERFGHDLPWSKDAAHADERASPGRGA